MKTYIKKGTTKGELEIYKVLNLLAPKYNKKFSVLLLPRAISIDEANQVLELPHYEGETFNHKWDESNGGLPLGLDLTKEIPQILKDLSQIDLSLVLQSKTLSGMPKLTFDHKEAVRYFESLALEFKNLKLITTQDYLRIQALLSYRQSTEMIINNGDFYPRNFIRTPDGRIVLIDWEVWNSNSPFFVIDHPENVAAVQFVHMWGNIDWQKAYRLELERQFSFEEESFNKGIVMKSLELANLWHKSGEKALVLNQIEVLKSILCG